MELDGPNHKTRRRRIVKIFDKTGIKQKYNFHSEKLLFQELPTRGRKTKPTAMEFQLKPIHIQLPNIQTMNDGTMKKRGKNRKKKLYITKNLRCLFHFCFVQAVPLPLF